jgi:hypothetical protein
MTGVALLARKESIRQTLARLREVAVTHRVFLALFGIGLALRVVVAVAYDPALLRPDSVSYLRVASRPPKPWPFHPIAYPSFLRVLPFDWSLAVIPVVQHLFGLVMATIIYATLARLGVRRWLAALAAAPVLLDAYQLNIEQHVLSETLFELFLLSACAVLLWRRPLGIVAAGGAGLLFAAAALSRSVGTFAVLPALIAAPFLAGGLPLRARLARPAILLALFALPLVGYATWFHTVHGRFTLTTYGGRFLYGRVVPFVDCTKFTVPEPEQPLCPTAPPGQRLTANQFMWSRGRSPVYRLDLPPGKTGNQVIGDFARRVVRNQPLDYLEAAGSDFLRTFAPIRQSRRDDVPLSRWQFHREYHDLGDLDWSRQGAGAYRTKFEVARVDPTVATLLARYQRIAYTWGPLLGLALVAALAATLGVGAAAGSGLRSGAFLFAGTGLVLLVASVAATAFSWRYHLPQIVLLPPAAAIAATALFVGRRGASSGSPQAPAADCRNE